MKVGRTFEDVIDRTEAQLTQQAQQALQAGLTIKLKELQHKNANRNG